MWLALTEQVADRPPTRPPHRTARCSPRDGSRGSDLLCTDLSAVSAVGATNGASVDRRERHGARRTRKKNVALLTTFGNKQQSFLAELRRAPPTPSETFLRGAKMFSAFKSRCTTSLSWMNFNPAAVCFATLFTTSCVLQRRPTDSGEDRDNGGDGDGLLPFSSWEQEPTALPSHTENLKRVNKSYTISIKFSVYYISSLPFTSGST